jgi:hypothetical protein
MPRPGRYIAPTEDSTGEVSDTIVRKLAVKAMLLRMLMPRYRDTCSEGNSKGSRLVMWRMGRGTHITRRVQRPIPVVHALENKIER